MQINTDVCQNCGQLCYGNCEIVISRVNKGCCYRIKAIPILQERFTCPRRHTGKRQKESRLSLVGSDSKWTRGVSGRALLLEQRAERGNSRCVKKLLGVRTKSTFFTYNLGTSVSFYHHHVVCLTTGPQILPKRVLHCVQSSASSFNSSILSFP